MQLIATCLMLFFIIVCSDGRLSRKLETKGEQNTLTMSLKDLAEPENPINLRGYSGVCDVNYVKIGCFQDKKNKPALSQELFQDRSSGDPNYSGRHVDWADYSAYLKGLACRCAQRSRQNGFTYFGLQDYGRCFSAPHTASSYNMHGSSNRCSNQLYQKCDDNAFGECVGKAKEVNYVYEIVEETKGEQNALAMSLKDLAEPENPINLRGYSGVCDVNYVKIGCFQDKKNKPALSQELFQDRSSGDPNYSGQGVDWTDYSAYLKGLACRCAQRSRQDGFSYFGLQDYGRCFSAPHAASSYNMHGSSNRCSNQHYQKCDDNAFGECVGKAKKVNYVYEIVEASSADGEISYGKAYDQTDYENQN